MIATRTDGVHTYAPLCSMRGVLGGLALAAALLAASEGQAQAGWSTGNPLDAVVGGIESNGTSLLICRSTDPRYPGKHPGKRQPSWNSCAIPYAGENFASSYETLTPSWKGATAYGQTSFGSESPGGATLGLCRGVLPGIPGAHVGKHIRGVNACSIGYGGAERWTSDYVDLSDDTFGIVAVSGRSNIAMVAGRDANLRPLYACVGSAPGVPGEHPGELYNGICHFGWGGQEKVTTNYKTLTPLYRNDSTEGPSNIPIFVAGTDTDGSLLGVCKRAVRGVQPGKYRFADKTCHISIAGREDVYTSGFDLLRVRSPK